MCRYFMSPKDILRKFQSFAHTEFTASQWTSLDAITAAMRSGMEPTDRGKPLVSPALSPVSIGTTAIRVLSVPVPAFQLGGTPLAVVPCTLIIGFAVRSPGQVLVPESDMPDTIDWRATESALLHYDASSVLQEVEMTAPPG